MLLPLLALLPAVPPPPEVLGSVRYDPATHVAGKSSGCGKSSPYQKGSLVTAKGNYDGVQWTYLVYVPKAYDSNKPMPLIIHHHGWGLTAKAESNGAGITALADKLGIIVVTPQGMGDNSHSGGPWYSWNAVGTVRSPGPGGPTCTSKGSHANYCYNSCGKKEGSAVEDVAEADEADDEEADGLESKRWSYSYSYGGGGGSSCPDSPQCWWTTCDETVTPTGTGTDAAGFIPGLYDTLESQLCIDTTREYASGESNGGMQTYQLGVALASRLAAIVPEFGSFHRGFAMAPSVGVPVLDLHGSRDTTVPGNVSLSGDGYYYTTTDEIFDGGKYSSGWKKSNGCKGGQKHWPTEWDGTDSFWCGVQGTCPGGDVVRCSWNGGHNWLFNSATANGGLVTKFLLQWAKTSHVGRGVSSHDSDEVKAAAAAKPLITDIVVDDDEASHPVGEWRPSQHEDAPRLHAVDAPDHRHHYGNPAHGCRHDEDELLVGSGRACAPRIGSEEAPPTPEGEATEPTPRCSLGGTKPTLNGCPYDAVVPRRSRAFPTCLAKGVTEAPYDNGEFHCLLVCPCAQEGIGAGAECGEQAHAHCPSGSRCERGELRHMAHGVCAYPLA